MRKYLKRVKGLRMLIKDHRAKILFKILEIGLNQLVLT